MARQLRIEYPGAFYHIYSRGNQKQTIFYDDADRFFFLKILREAHERFNALWCLYCLMDNHYHLGAETLESNLSRLMHFVNCSYSVYLNTKHGRSGHLFQGRYKAILVQTDRYARTLAKYIHGNPVRKGLVQSPESYEWSSYRYYVGAGSVPSWLNTTLILGCFNGSKDCLAIEHQSYLTDLNDPSIEGDLAKASRTGILGDVDFIEKIRRAYLKDRLKEPDAEIPELKRLRPRPTLAIIKELFEQELGQDNRLVKKGTIFFAHRYADYALKEIGAFFGLGPSAISMAYKRAAEILAGNETLSRACGSVMSKFFSEDQVP